MRETSVAFSEGWWRMSASIGWAGRKIGAAVKEGGLARSGSQPEDAPAAYQVGPGGQLPPYHSSGGGAVGGGGIGGRGVAPGAGGGGGGGVLRFGGDSDDLDRQLSGLDPLDSPPPGYAPAAVPPAPSQARA
ncbi:hypothetical protein MNEG_1802 [Monoraphidium neglectum]|uniref:Uncharacterized protein n=1 Tax=Monoraphidium neglectum TaxID=145388 RepID=A0A0D2NP12_9CHLO|nr:hypothetical protein MNEG_1802 [Monoraphidium neglectum]KIZ06156.1 hypothetical protein MNEG_1802 [Monoraphidium neglectum]|eukprot:XP_013905175.1 hypothetical protein MNEG_1802 [Monoraphidium neglectum]